MKKLLLFVLFICANTGFSQKVTDSIFSKKLNEDREITIGLPPSYEKPETKIHPGGKSQNIIR